MKYIRHEGETFRKNHSSPPPHPPQHVKPPKDWRVRWTTKKTVWKVRGGWTCGLSTPETAYPCNTCQSKPASNPIVPSPPHPNPTSGRWLFTKLEVWSLYSCLLALTVSFYTILTYTGQYNGNQVYICTNENMYSHFMILKWKKYDIVINWEFRFFALWTSEVDRSLSSALPILKETVARDFLASVFFMDLLCMGVRFRG